MVNPIDQKIYLKVEIRLLYLVGCDFRNILSYTLDISPLIGVPAICLYFIYLITKYYSLMITFPMIVKLDDAVL